MLENHDHKHAVHEFDGILENRVNTPPVYFTVLFYGLIIWGVAFMAFYLLSGWSSDAEFQQKMAAHQGTPVTQEQSAQEQSAQEQSAQEQSAQGQPPQEQPSKAPAVASQQDSAEPDGQQLFASHCASCHGAEGKGGFGPDLSGDYKYGKSTMAVTESISSGRPGNMPAFDSKLSPDEIEALVEFILSL